MNPPKQKTPSTSSYAQIAQQTQFPTREQAIVLDSIEGILIQDYTVAIGNIVESPSVWMSPRWGFRTEHKTLWQFIGGIISG